MAHSYDLILSKYELVEGPRYDDANGIYFCDSQQGGVFLLDRAGKIATVIPKRKGVGGIALHADGGIVVSGRNICHVKHGVSRVCRTTAPFVQRYCHDPSGRLYVGALRFDPFNPDAQVIPANMPHW